MNKLRGISVLLLSFLLIGCGNSLTSEQQETWDLIESGIKENPEWDELFSWINENANDNFIWNLANEDGELLSEELFKNIQEFGWTGTFLGAEPWINDEGGVRLKTKWENLEYNANLEQLNSMTFTSEVELYNWVEENLSDSFASIIHREIDRDWNDIGDEWYSREFVAWTTEQSWGYLENSWIEVITQFDVVMQSRREIQQQVVDLIESKDRTEYIKEDLGPRRIEEFANWLEIDQIQLGEGLFSINVKQVDMNGNAFDQNNRSTGELNEDSFVSWDFEANLLENNANPEGLMVITITQTYDVETDTSGITRDNFDKIQDGMTLDEVAALLGSQGSVDVASGNIEIRTWTKSFSNASTRIVSITFQDGKVTAKAQAGM